MKNLILAATAVTLSVSLASCATAPKPEIVCTSDWIGKRSDVAIGRIESKAGRSMDALTKAAESWSRGKKPGLFQLLALQNSFKGLEKELKTGRGMKDLKTLASTCNDPGIISDAIGGALRRRDLPPQMINFIESSQQYKRLIAPNPSTLKTAQLLTK